MVCDMVTYSYGYIQLVCFLGRKWYAEAFRLRWYWEAAGWLVKPDVVKEVKYTNYGKNISFSR